MSDILVEIFKIRPRCPSYTAKPEIGANDIFCEVQLPRLWVQAYYDRCSKSCSVFHARPTDIQVKTEASRREVGVVPVIFMGVRPRYNSTPRGFDSFTGRHRVR